MKAETKSLVFYWALVLGATGLIIGLTWFMGTDTFKYGLAVGTDIASFSGRWFLRGLLVMFLIWLAEHVIANGVAKGIAQAKAAEAKQSVSFNEGFKEFRDAKLAAAQDQK